MVTSWETFAVLHQDGTFGNVGWQRYCEAHISSRGKESVIPVIATLVTDPNERTHWSWIDKDSDTPAWSLTWPREAQFQVCFPYGVRAETEAGRGHAIWLKVAKKGCTRE